MSLELLVALATLTPCQREAFVDRYLVGRSMAEIAETMGCSRQNVKNLIGRARIRLAARPELQPA